jgi:hypothetical protein
LSSDDEIMLPDSGTDGEKMPEVSSGCSLDLLDQEAYVSDYASDDLDKLSTCLSEVSSEELDSKRNSIFRDIFQAQLALWTLIISIFYSYAWQQHRKKFLISLFVVVPPVIIVCCTMSSLLTAIVILGRIFSAPLRFDDMLKCGQYEADSDDMQLNGMQNIVRRRRSASGNSSVSGRSSSCEELPKPACRKHSTCSTSQLQLNSPLSPTTFTFTNGNGGYFGLTGRSASITSTRMGYTYTHCSGGGDEFKEERCT